MGEQINYVPLLPQKPPEDLVSWAIQQGELSREYLVYRSGRRYLPLEDRTEDCVDVTCSSCGNTFEADKVRADGCPGYASFGWFNPLTTETVISGSPTTCPCCGEGMETLYIGSMGAGSKIQKTWAAVFYRLSIAGKRDRLLLVDWQIVKSVDKRAQTRFGTHIHSAWVVEEKKIVRIMGHRRFMGSAVMIGPEQRKTFRDDFKCARLIYPWDSGILTGTTAENSKLDRYIEAGGTRLVAYLGLYLKHPQVENLVMQGLAPLVKELLDTECARSAYESRRGYPKLDEWINWKEKKPAKMLGMTREQLRIFLRRGWTRSALEAIAWCSAAGLTAQWSEGIELVRSRGTYECKRILDEQGKDGFWKTLRYLAASNHDYSYLRDYWDMAGKLQMDLENQQVRWPKNLRRAHDNAMERVNAQKDAETSAAVEKRVRELGWLSWERDGLTIRPCASVQELRAEGKELHHCVATYANRYAEGKTAIFFIRRKDAPDVPFFTLELDEENLTVRQNRGMRNRARTEEVQAFEEAWLEWVKKEAKKRKKRKGKAA